MLTGYSLEQPPVSEVWARAGYAYDATDHLDHLYKTLRGVAEVVVNKPREEPDPGVHKVDPGENVTVITEPE
eukprot:9892275-Karenia_brevis.AAC.1